MTHVVFHLNESFISEDLDYYFSSQRDKHNQVRPREDIISMTPVSSNIVLDFTSGRVGNFLFPLSMRSVDRVYIGTSIPLFANNWGASFLLELLKLIKPTGAIVLPVYPEGQAKEKGYWSRSFLENVFLSRQRWTGYSNVNAENDGVMSLRIGRKLPDPILSTAEWFFNQRANLLLTKIVEQGNYDNEVLLSYFLALARLVWNNFSKSAVVEKIIADFFGSKQKIKGLHVGIDGGLLLVDLLLSSYISLESAITYGINTDSSTLATNLTEYFAPILNDRHQHKHFHKENKLTEKPKIIVVSDVLKIISRQDYEGILQQAWAQLESQGILVVYENFVSSGQTMQPSDVDALLSVFGKINYYSGYVATQVRDGVSISHYSPHIESALRHEQHDKSTVFRVLRKT